MQNLFWIIQPCFIKKQHHQGMLCVWIKGLLSAKSVKIVAIFYLYRGKRTSDGGNGNHSVSLPIILIKIKVDQMLPSSYISSLLVSIL